MKIHLALPSFWTEPRDPWAWQRALRRLDPIPDVPDPRPAWEGPLKGLLSRRAVPGLYGLRVTSGGGTLLGCGLLQRTGARWAVDPEVKGLIEADRETFQVHLARWLVRRSPWTRACLSRLAAGSWEIVGSGHDVHRLRVKVRTDSKGRPARKVQIEWSAAVSGVGLALEATVDPRSLSPLSSPLYLLRALGWITAAGCPDLPADLRQELSVEPPADALRRVSTQEADVRGFVAVERAARYLWNSVYGTAAPRNLASWSDRVFGAAIASGAIEVHDWASGQARHGRGHLGDRDRRLVRWTIHPNFELQGEPR